MDITKNNLYKDAIETYGIKAQVAMVFEEMAELQKELCKWLRGKENITAITEEIADVRIMLEQMELYFNIDEEVKKEQIRKLYRLMNRVYRTDAKKEKQQ